MAIRRLSKAKPSVRTLVLVLLLVAGTGALRAAVEHRHDAFAKTVQPFLNIFAKERKSEDRAFTLKFRIEKSTDLPAEMLGQQAEMAVQVPDKLRLRGPLFGEIFTLVRDGEKIWISPGSKARALLNAATTGKELPPPDKKAKLTEFELPFSEKNLVFLPALFAVKDLGFEPLDGVECRVEDITLMPELADQVKTDGWIARLWITPDHKPARVTVARKGWNIVARIDAVQFAKQLPADTWKPAPEEQADLLELNPQEYDRFLSALAGTRGRKAR